MKFFMKRRLTAMKDARILGMDAGKSVCMIMAGILYESGLIQKLNTIQYQEHGRVPYKKGICPVFIIYKIKIG